MDSICRRLRVVIRGGGDLGSGVVYRLHRAGLSILVTELERPLFVRRSVCYGAAAFESVCEIEGITARRVQDLGAVAAVLSADEVPVVIDPEGGALRALRPHVVVDARMAKTPQDCSLGDADLVIGLGPGFVAGTHCHAVIETNRGHYLGRVYWEGAAEPDTGVPGRVDGIASLRVLRSPASGTVEPLKAIGDPVRAGETVLRVSGIPVQSRIDGVVRGLIDPSVTVTQDMKVGDVDPRGNRDHCFSISEKSLAIGGGVLEAVLYADQIRRLLAR